MTWVETTSQKPFLIFGSWYTSNPASWTSPYIYFHLFLIKNNFCLLSWSLEVYKGATLSDLNFTSKPISLASPLNPQPRSMKIHWSPVQIFKLYLLQVWTRFAKFDEIHSNPSPKILRKIWQPLGALRGHLTKSQLQEKFSSYHIISSNTCWTLFL